MQLRTKTHNCYSNTGVVKQRDQKFVASLGYMVKPCLKEGGVGVGEEEEAEERR